ncbi:16S rRNA (adenine(1518)-N(6)/adenine(1519)-N(6))-dimethyltransferase RsmA [Cyanobium sp. NIES-981]|uniref:16S rRNA (adenine(1518)-N(6)/adenine(1519)-N(6))- dimethyltransferase RsmA n=1 Tax=Cyanobium sp. NIES-981 TaxID=1851505 RepID=UPI0007DCBD0E|nr:16S rRNA (adenine(1518)-N(6)/adenine(1519)-N(6))-dimethyltransferase RsmA [Cyanobium sp. NIES-981]SBO42378.1 Ribosomal RNA small subunit methyltransferase A [Cyanobium sp. NIES-981]
MSFAAHRARKRFGQHWLTDAAVLDRIVAAADLRPEERVLEIGPGRGALTGRLLASGAAAVAAVELDRDLVAGLRQRFGGDPRFALHQGDALALSLPPADKVVANIPYNITGPLLERLVGRLDRPVQPPYRRLVLLLQREVAERIRCSPGSPAYSALSVRMQLLGECRTVCPVPPRCFQPPPKVQSEVILIEPHGAGELPEASLARTTEQLLRRSFAARRKMLRNSLAGLLPEGELQDLAEQAGIGLQQRPQEIAPAAWLRLAAGLNRSTGVLPAPPACHG